MLRLSTFALQVVLLLVLCSPRAARAQSDSSPEGAAAEGGDAGNNRTSLDDLGGTPQPETEADADLEDLSTELLGALRIYKRRYIRVQDIQTTYYTDGTYSGTSFGWRITGAGQERWEAMPFMELTGDSGRLSEFASKRAKLEKEQFVGIPLGLTSLAGTLYSVGTAVWLEDEIGYIDFRQGSGYWSYYDSSDCLELDDSDLRARCGKLDGRIGSLVAGVVLAGATGGALAAVGSTLMYKRSAMDRVSHWYSKEEAMEAVDEFNLALARELGFPDDIARRLILLSTNYRRRPAPTLSPQIGLGFFGVSGTF